MQGHTRTYKKCKAPAWPSASARRGGPVPLPPTTSATSTASPKTSQGQRNSGGGGSKGWTTRRQRGPSGCAPPPVSYGRAPHNSTTQSPARHTTSTWRGGAAVLTVKPSAPCTHLTEDRDKGPQAPMPAAVQIVPEAQPREKAPKKPKSGKERALTKRDKKEKVKEKGLRANSREVSELQASGPPDHRVGEDKKRCYLVEKALENVY